MILTNLTNACSVKCKSLHLNGSTGWFLHPTKSTVSLFLRTGIHLVHKQLIIHVRLIKG